MSVSVKGVIRHRGLMSHVVHGKMSLVQTLFPTEWTGTISTIWPPASVREELEALAYTPRSFDWEECTFGMTAAFDQTWSDVTIRIRLNPDSDVSQATLDTLEQTWKAGIETTWSDRWGIGRSDEVTCPIRVRVRWVDSYPHHDVRVNTGQKCFNAMTVGPVQCPTNSARWHTSDGGMVAAHEAGHMLGNPDEYVDLNCPDRDPVGTGTVMDNNSSVVPRRLLSTCASHVGSSVVAL
ncbi:MAG TPA: hypothetical protein VHF89_11170 [Solirubrobacteraceae bacterium]|nr:hypothetical protein [Solirubrobacteraceae bacterium]